MTVTDFYQQRKEQQEAQKAFDEKYLDKVTGVYVNVPVKGRWPAENSLAERLSKAISGDSRTRFEGQPHEDLQTKRLAAYQESLKVLEEKNKQSTAAIEARVFDHMETMNLGREYRASVPHWVAEGDDE